MPRANKAVEGSGICVAVISMLASVRNEFRYPLPPTESPPPLILVSEVEKPSEVDASCDVTAGLPPTTVPFVTLKNPPFPPATSKLLLRLTSRRIAFELSYSL